MKIYYASSVVFYFQYHYHRYTIYGQYWSVVCFGHGPFSISWWAVLDVAVDRFGLAMSRFGHTENLWAVLVRAVLVHGPFW